MATQAVGCHATADTDAAAVFRYQPSAVLAMGVFVRRPDGTWHREVARQCWVRTEPGPVQFFGSKQEAEQYAASLQSTPAPTVVAAPHSPSRSSLTGPLRAELGFDGVIITDDFTMEGVLQGYGADRAAVLSVQAGADMAMVVAPESRQREVYTALMDAVAAGDVPAQRIDASVRRILTLKRRYGLLEL